MKLNYGRKTSVTVCLLLVAGCGAFNKKKSDDGDGNPYGKSEDLQGIIDTLIIPDHAFGLKMIEAKTSTGTMVSRETYEDLGEGRSKDTTEKFDSAGKLSYRDTYTSGEKYCDGSSSTYESFGYMASKSGHRYERTCVDTLLMKDLSFDIDESGNESLYKTETYTYDNHEDEIKKITEAKNQTTVIKETSYKRNSDDRIIEELVVENGKLISKELRDYSAGTETKWVPAKGASELNVEQSYTKDLPRGFEPFFNSSSDGLRRGFYSEARTFEYDAHINAKCSATSSGIQCNQIETDATDGSTQTVDVTAIPQLYQLKDEARFRALLGDDNASRYIQNHAVIMNYLSTKEITVKTDSKGVKTTKTVTSKYNDKNKLIHKETTTVVEGGKTTTEIEDDTYDAGGLKQLSKTVTKDGVKTIYTYSY